MRVQKLISNCGYCSRRKAEDLIKDGRVSVNGKVVSIGDQCEENDKVMVEGNLLNIKRKLYIMLNKPRGFMTTLADPSNKKNVGSLVDVGERVYPIGRLDLYSTGLLLMTNDGDFANKIMHPRFEMSKEYVAKVHPYTSKKVVDKMNSTNIVIDKRGVKVKFVYIDKNKIRLTLHEGRHKIVKRVLKEFDYYVKDLERVKIGNLGLGGLKYGKWRYLKKDEIKGLTDLSVLKK